MRFLMQGLGVVGLSTIVALGVAWASTSFHGNIFAAEPPRPRLASDLKVEKLNGRVAELLRNPHGDVDGLKLDGGQEIHFPPHLATEVSGMAQVGNDIRVDAFQNTRTKGEVVWEASKIENGGRVLIIDRPELNGPRPLGRDSKPGPGAGPQKDEEPMNATGKVRELHLNKHGDVDGLLLADGTEVKFPPHQGRQLQDLIHEGDDVKVAGRRHVTPHGDVHLHADMITAISSGRTLERDEPRRPHAPPPHHRPGPADPQAGEQYQEILKELREMRKLLEGLQK